jgi:biopolymer transport protein ExbD
MKYEFFRSRRSQHHSLNELNITPLLDLVFVLLVIFIITTPQLMNNLEMNLPSGAPKPAPGPKPKIDRLFVDEKGQAFLNGERLSLPALKEKLQTLKAAGPEFGVVVHGADEVDYQNMVNVLDVLQQLQITKVGLATETGDTGP